MAGATDILGLNDAKVLVTGAGAGLGKATALRLPSALRTRRTSCC